MVRILQFLGAISFVGAIIIGIVQANQSDGAMELILGSSYEEGFRWGVAVYWWVSGAVALIIFLALAMILEYLSDISYRVRNLEHEANKNAAPKQSLGNSKASINKLDGFKL